MFRSIRGDAFVDVVVRPSQVSVADFGKRGAERWRRRLSVPSRRRSGKAELLARLPLLAGLPRAELERLAQGTEDLEFSAGKVLCREGERPREFFMIVSGSAEITRGGDHVRGLDAGDIFGQLALIEDVARSTTVTARTPLRALVLSRSAFWRLIRDSGEVERRVLRALVAENVAERIVAEDAFRRQVELTTHQAAHDALTGLPNRTLFADRVEQASLEGSRYGSRFAVMLMDLDRFKEVNDALGHHAGDSLLTEVASRLRGAVRESDTVARLGGDEFGFLIRRNDLRQIETTVKRLTAVLERSLLVDGVALTIESSIGVAVFPEHGSDVGEILRNADIAMYEAKNGSRSYAIYRGNVKGSHGRRLMLLADLRDGLERGELVVHYQPKADLATGCITSVEALARWIHPEHGLIGPNEFIPLAEQTSLIKPLALHVIDEAVHQCAVWREKGLDLRVAVNLSMRNLLDTDLPRDIQRVLDRYGVSARALDVEITESAIQADPARTTATVEKLSAMGIRISIDDFGTGYSSFSSLSRLPVSEIKIDRSFVTNMLTDKNSAGIVRSMIALGRNLDLTVVGEGVETAASYERLMTLGCDTAQGFYLNRAVSADELEEWLQERRSHPVDPEGRPNRDALLHADVAPSTAA